MKSFEYGDEGISEKEILFAVPSMVIGVGVLSLPKALAEATMFSDGWISLLIAGIISVIMIWLIARLAANFPNQTFLTYASAIITKPVALVLTAVFAVISLNLAAYSVRKIADISKHYLLDQTPLEVIALSFFLLVIYGVSGSRAGLLRLNMLFLPIILLIAVVILVFNLGWFEFGNLIPMFETSFSEHVEGMGTSATAYLGFVVVWFYVALVKQPKKAPKMAAIGMSIPVVLYLLFFIVCIGVFGHAVTSNLLYPTVELGKVVEIPGGFFERFDSVFFVIWIMAIFNTTAMALDIAVLATNSIFKKVRKIRLIFILAPIAYGISMYPQTVLEVDAFGEVLGYGAFFYTLFTLVLLLAFAKMRGVKGDE
ncbi:spore germination protein [Virgibacillus natechei]|uniref:Spore germination protein n=1 Tax=Virgibacillus natechei TaxID=1216297 RepID=A0ABS4IHM5_9BACI|nr:endospore germination permease [Virgibacillus natechei]MBP1970453.1 spore germination protein [Virgibacillus natechei]UZD13897.1 spore germination protein [Virgibacillus natechei]